MLLGACSTSLCHNASVRGSTHITINGTHLQSMILKIRSQTSFQRSYVRWAPSALQDIRHEPQLRLGFHFDRPWHEIMRTRSCGKDLLIHMEKLTYRVVP